MHLYLLEKIKNNCYTGNLYKEVENFFSLSKLTVHQSGFEPLNIQIWKCISMHGPHGPRVGCNLLFSSIRIFFVMKTNFAYLGSK